ncbi:MAG: large-conductance mechanosensitive channel protein MscL [Clostridiales Family XIII bacterium]|jgi:large conductance mechanosensitive channel|nr:large-conductance mechanosensitive channel protein MscL [Clostridiales Family XIII bacterium]
MADIETKAKGFVGEFKEFIMRGNVVDMAVGVVIGAAFKSIIDALVANVINPIIGLATGGVDFSKLSVTIGGDLTIGYGAFIQTIISFVLIAFVVFLMVKAINGFRKKQDDAPAAPSELDVLTEIRDLLKTQQGS